MTEREAVALIYTYEDQRDPVPHVIGTHYDSSHAYMDSSVDMGWIKILQNVASYYIQITNMLDHTDYVLTTDQKILLSKQLFFNQQRWGWDISNYPVALAHLIDDAEFTVIAIKWEG